MPDEPADPVLRDNEPITPAVKTTGPPPVNNPRLLIVNDALDILRGPLLKYKGMQIVESEVPAFWHGNVLIVANPVFSSPISKARVPRDPEPDEPERMLTAK